MMEKPIAITPEGEILITALVVHWLHLESHGCEQCINGYETLVLAVTQWLKSQTKMEVNSGDKKEIGKESEGPEAGEEDPLAIFG